MKSSPYRSATTLADAAPSSALRGLTDALLRSINKLIDNFYALLREAVTAVRKYGWALSRFSSAFSYATKIGEGMNAVALGDDPEARRAYDQGYEHGLRDARFVKANPKKAAIDVDWRKTWARRGSAYQLAYDGGYARGWAVALR